jgi:glycine cleavage system T protein (aminomethyltransferase)
MLKSAVVSPARPRLLAPGAPALDPGVERYLVKAGGSSVFALDCGDRLELALMHGGQSIEILAFGKDGRPDLPALGLRGKIHPAGLQKILAGGSDDPERVRFGLFRRGLDIGRVRAALLFGPDAPAGEAIALDAQRPVVVVIAVPAEPMLVWDQTPPSDLLAFIARVHPPPPGRPRLPEPLAEPRLDLTIDIASAESFEVFDGEYIQIIDVAGRQCSDFLAFHRRALDKGTVLGLDATTTRTMTGLAYPAPGLYAKFFDRDRNPLVEVVHDTVGRHDTFNLACTARYYEDLGYFGHPNCSDNFNAALAAFEVGNYRGWPAINFFFNTNVDALNGIWFDEPWSRPGDYVLMRALTDLVCATSSCPCDVDPANGWQLSEIHVRVYPKTASFQRAIGTRMTPDAPLQLTRETGFHPRTAQLTRAFSEYRGFWMPQHFARSGAIEEYWACRERVVVMDLSPLRKLEILGPDAEPFLQGLFPRDIRRLAVGQVVYSALCYEHGGMVDDGTLFRLGDNNFRWVGGDDASLVWIREQAAKSGAKLLLKNASDQIHNLAVQGPKSRDTLRAILWTPPGRPTLDELGWFRFTVGRFGGYDGIPVLVSRTGYTGELGYEVFCHPKDAPAVWDAIMEAGAVHEILPFGFEALDMVRIEAGLIFGGYEFDSTTDPFEAGIGFTVPAKKEEDYLGKAVLERRRIAPLRRLVGLDIEGNEKAVHGDRVYKGRAEIGVITSGMRSPLLKRTIALARLDVAYTGLGTPVAVGKLDGHRKRLPAKVVRFPFYDPEKARVRA